MAGKRGSTGDPTPGAADAEEALKAELLARLSRMSYRDLLALTLDATLGARTGVTYEVRDSRPIGVVEAGNDAARRRRARPAKPPEVEDAPTEEPNWQRVEATCPKCGKEGMVIPDFGLARRADGSYRPQSWCRDCRNGTSYHPPRKAAEPKVTAAKRGPGK
jgi:hypothetical protein